MYFFVHLINVRARDYYVDPRLHPDTTGYKSESKTAVRFDKYIVKCGYKSDFKKSFSKITSFSKLRII